METFFCNEDYQEYLSLLVQWCGEFDVRIWAYCLMPNHVHLILLPSTTDGLARALGEIHQRYTRRINFREGWRGHLWQGRFASFVMSEKHLMGAARYVERNPVKADLVERAEDWPWSSAAAHCMACDGVDMTQMRPVTSEAESEDGSETEHLGSCTQTVAECDWLIDRTAGMTSTWSEHLAWQDDTELAKLMPQRENTGRPLGDTDFVKLMGKLLSRDLLPKKPGPKGPRKKAKSNN